MSYIFCDCIVNLPFGTLNCLINVIHAMRASADYRFYCSYKFWRFTYFPVCTDLKNARKQIRKTTRVLMLTNMENF